MTSIEKFLVNWEKGIKEEFRVTPEDIHKYYSKKEYEDSVILPLIRKLGIAENDSELSESTKYPGDY
ncbi:MAG: hypothetical protein L0H53_03355 [Candidatus Nitrosocosmicus sp.]|nr:hypothetical protein [Candidatus Nitrosocosmicus sp.]MDN5867950.1 hypothetical protein [Candidatus Nitrosocosmicus sp.]